MKAEYTFQIEGQTYMEQVTTALLASGYILSSKKLVNDTYKISIYGKADAISLKPEDLFIKGTPMPGIKSKGWGGTYYQDTVTSTASIKSNHDVTYDYPRNYEMGKNDE